MVGSTGITIANVGVRALRLSSSRSAAHAGGLPGGPMRVMILLYGLFAYLVFLASVVYAIGFVANVGVPKGIDDGNATGVGAALLVDLALLSLFAVQHSVMARRGFKRWWTRIVPRPAERSTYVLLTSVILFLIFWQWRPIPGDVWTFEHPLTRGVMWAIYALGWSCVLLSTFLIDHWDLFGTRQVWLHFRGREYTHPEFKEVSLYRHVRHPLLLGFTIAFWATPDMTWGHLLFAVTTTAYMIAAVRLEERDLLHFHGDRYRDYQQRVPMMIPTGSRERR